MPYLMGMGGIPAHYRSCCPHPVCYKQVFVQACRFAIDSLEISDSHYNLLSLNASGSVLPG